MEPQRTYPTFPCTFSQSILQVVPCTALLQQQSGVSHHRAIMENIFHPDPFQLLELPQHFVQGTFKALQSCDVKWVQIVAFCCNLTLMNASGERKRENKTRLYLAQKKTTLKAETFQPCLYILLLNF